MADAVIDANRRYSSGGDRRARQRGGRRDGDAKSPWYLRRKLWLGIISVAYVGWRRLAGRSQAT